MKKGFTLIEVLVVLTILALMAILAYGYFSSTVEEATSKQAMTKYLKDMEVMEYAFQRTGIWLNGLASTINALNAEAAKHWRVKPAPDPNWKSSWHCSLATYIPGGTHGYQYSAGLNLKDLPSGPSIGDPIVHLNCLSKEFCEAFNTHVVDRNGVIPTQYDMITQDEPGICYGLEGSSNSYKVAWLLEIH